jgi:hypothetical protein
MRTQNYAAMQAPGIWHNPFAASKKSLEGHMVFFESAFVALPEAAVLVLFAIALFRLLDVSLVFFDFFAVVLNCP